MSHKLPNTINSSTLDSSTVNEIKQSPPAQAAEWFTIDSRGVDADQ